MWQRIYLFLLLVMSSFFAGLSSFAQVGKLTGQLSVSDIFYNGIRNPIIHFRPAAHATFRNREDPRVVSLPLSYTFGSQSRQAKAPARDEQGWE
jgi:hypothetical protein